MLTTHLAAGRLSKASMFAVVVPCHNLGVAISSALGAWLLASLRCNPRGAAMDTSEFQHLWIASGVSSGLDHAIVCFLLGVGRSWDGNKEANEMVWEVQLVLESQACCLCWASLPCLALSPRSALAKRFQHSCSGATAPGINHCWLLHQTGLQTPVSQAPWKFHKESALPCHVLDCIS